MFKLRIALFDLLDLGVHSLKHPLDCSKRKNNKLETLECKIRLTQDVFAGKNIVYSFVEFVETSYENKCFLSIKLPLLDPKI